ncbi:MAG: acetyl-CoA C-acyltransferase [Bacteroidota bacterium]
MKNEVVIVSAVRTPIGSFGGSLSTIPATKLGATAIKGALDRINLSSKLIEEVFFGNVIQANLGQAPARQASIYAGIPNTVPCTTVNKVCSSGLKAMMIGAQSILAGDNEIVMTGGMENMSQIPHYFPNGRTGQKLGDFKMADGMLRDGLLDAYSGKHMGESAELCASEMNFTREEQDSYSVESYTRSAKAWENGNFANEIVPVEIPQRRGDAIVVSEDEEFKNVKFEKIPGLRPVFKKDGTVTAANASTINDGAAAVILMSRKKADELGIKPLAVIKSYADAAHEPEWFTTAPAKAMNKALDKAGMKLSDMEFFEINEAFAVVSLANMKLMEMDPDKTNINGGAVSLGHPLGCSGARIMVTLLNVLEQNNAKYGLAGICNGGGGASAMIIEKL